MSRKRKCIVILLFIVIVSILFILYNRSQFFFGTLYHCTYSVYQLHSKSFKNHKNFIVPQCPVRFLTVQPGGQLGNFIWEYISVLAFQKVYRFNGSVLFSPKMTKYLEDLFHRVYSSNNIKITRCVENHLINYRIQMIGLTEKPRSSYLAADNLAVVLETFSCRYNDLAAYGLEDMRQKLRIDHPEFSDLPESCLRKTRVRKINLMEEPTFFNFYQNNLLVILSAYSYRYIDVLSYGLENINQILRFRQEWIDQGTHVLKNIKASFGFNETDVVTFIGVHYRGGDYNNALIRIYSNEFVGPPTFRYYRNAMRYFKNTTENPIFVFSTIDNNWAVQNLKYLKNFKIFELISAGTVEDLVALSLCNHSIINYGTYGASAALLSNGTTFVYDSKLPNDGKGYTLANNMAKVFPNWFLCDDISPCNT